MRRDRPKRREVVSIAPGLESELVAETQQQIARLAANFPALIAIATDTLDYDEGEMIWRTKMRLSRDPQMHDIPMRGPQSGLDPTQALAASVGLLHLAAPFRLARGHWSN
ncbi:MAG: hypothetical protein CL812_12630 [Confluentimicrobium sp.]|nr:hypothetical protein [Actibacterium sp.]